MPKKLTHEEFLDKFKKQNSNSENIEILGKYEGSKIKIKCKCRLDGYEWEVLPSSLLKGIGCPKCYGNIQKTTKEFKQEIKEVNSNIEILGTYKNNKTKIKCRCKLDGNIWYATPNSLLKNQGCPKCAGRDKTTEEFKQEIKKINENIEILGEYINSITKIKCRCKLDGNIWYVTPNHLLQGSSCPKCSNHIKLTHEEFINRIKKVNDNIEILEKLKDATTKIKCKCKKCNHTWYATPSNLLYNNSDCPKCNASKGEKRIAKYLDNKNIKYIHDKRYFKDLKSSKNKTLRPDFIIENMKIWIEFDGEQHFKIVDFANRGKEWAEKQFKEIQENDKLKNEYAKKHGWKLIRIPYWEYNNIEEILDKELNNIK